MALSPLPTALVGSAGLGLGSGLGSVPGGQPSTPNLNTAGQIDPSSIERAYAALGLTYQGNQVPPQPNQATSRALNAIGKHSQRTQGQHKGWASTVGGVTHTVHHSLWKKCKDKHLKQISASELLLRKTVFIF